MVLLLREFGEKMILGIPAIKDIWLGCVYRGRGMASPSHIPIGVVLKHSKSLVSLELRIMLVFGKEECASNRREVVLLRPLAGAPPCTTSSLTCVHSVLAPISNTNSVLTRACDQSGASLAA